MNPMNSFIFDITRLSTKTVSNTEKNSMLWKYYLFHRKAESLFEQFYLNRHGLYKIKRPISFCTTVMDRFEHLRETFINNIISNKTYPCCEYVLLNYNCPDPRTDHYVKTVLAEYIESGKVNYYKYNNSKYPEYNAAHARNLAFRLAQNEITCNVDADNFIGSGFAEYVSAMFSFDNIFLRGPVDRRGIAGRICCNKRHWETIGGYDERFRNWGVEDSDFSERLGRTGVERKTILNEEFCKCIQHDDDTRSRHYSVDIHTSYKFNRMIKINNAESGIINPNGSNFGHGCVQKNFAEQIEI